MAGVNSLFLLKAILFLGGRWKGCCRKLDARIVEVDLFYY